MSGDWMRKGAGNLAAPSPEIQARHNAARGLTDGTDQAGLTPLERELLALLQEGVTTAWCDAVIGCMPQLGGQRAAAFRDDFYDWQRRARTAIAKARAIVLPRIDIARFRASLKGVALPVLVTRYGKPCFVVTPLPPVKP